MAQTERWSVWLQRVWTGRGPAAWLLWPLSLVMRTVVAMRRALYRHGLFRSVRLPVPVVVVGNLVAGGAGKTPTVLALVTLLREQGHHPGIVSRGYGRRGDGVTRVTAETPVTDAGDEPLLLHLRSGVPVWVGRDRVAAGQALLAHHPETTVIVSDDGLQHLALARDLQLVVFDERGAGNGWLLPAGPLREPLPAAGAWPGGVPTTVIYNAVAPTTPLPGTLATGRLAGAVLLQDWWQGAAAAPSTLFSLKGRPVLAAAGTARPQRFFGMLHAAGLDLIEMPLPDHHPYPTLPWPADTPDVLVTEKDAIKLTSGRLVTSAMTHIWVVPLDLHLDASLVPWLREHLPDTAAPQANPHDHGHPTA